MADVLVIVPTYNECDNIVGILQRIRAAVDTADILIVDDSSTDGTAALADEAAAADDHIRVLHRSVKDGLGRAYLAGISYALDRGYRRIVEIDADGSHDPAALPAMLSLADSGADLVIGSRWIDGGRIQNWPWYREVISRAGNGYSRMVLRSKIHDITAGFRVFRADLLRALPLNDVASQGYCFQVEMAWRAERSGFRVVEYPITFVERVHGTSKMHLGIVTEALWRITLWGIRPGA